MCFKLKQLPRFSKEFLTVRPTGIGGNHVAENARGVFRRSNCSRCVAGIAVRNASAYLPGVFFEEQGRDQLRMTAPPPVVVVAPAIQKTVPIYREYVGRTVANYTVDVRPQATGILESSPFAEGQAVKKGQILFTIDPSEYKAALQSAEAQLAKAEADVAQTQASLGKNQQDVARYSPLVKEQAIPQEQYDDAVAAEKAAAAQVKQAQAEVKGAQAAINQAEINLGYTVIRSPLDGIAGKRQVDPGNLVSPGTATPLVTISSVTPVRADFNISEADYLHYVSQTKNQAARKQSA